MLHRFDSVTSDFSINTLRPGHICQHFGGDISKCIFSNDNFQFRWKKITLNYVPKRPINNIPSLVQIMVCHRPGDKPLSESMKVRLLTHICVTQPQRIKMLPHGWYPINFVTWSSPSLCLKMSCMIGINSADDKIRHNFVQVSLDIMISYKWFISRWSYSILTTYRKKYRITLSVRRNVIWVLGLT